MSKSIKTYELTIPRNQYDRLASAFDSMVDQDDFVKFDAVEDSVTFRVPEYLRLRFVKHAANKDKCICRDGDKCRKFWITQMFLPENIDPFLVTH